MWDPYSSSIIGQVEGTPRIVGMLRDSGGRLTAHHPGRGVAVLLVCLACAALVAVCMHAQARRVELVERSLVDRFLADQAALDRTETSAQGLKQMEDQNLAEGDDLSAGMQQHATAGLGALMGVDGDTARALRAADGAIQNVGLKGGRGSLLGDLTGTQLQSEMSDGGMPTVSNNAHVGESLKEEMEASRKELADVAAGMRQTSWGARWHACKGCSGVISGYASRMPYV